MLEENHSIQASRKNLRNFGLSVGFVCVAVAGFLFWKEKEAYGYFFAIGLILVCCGSTLPHFLKPVYLVWMRFASILGWIMTRVILCLLFYLIITPIALVSRLMGKQFIDLEWDAKQRTYWKYMKLNESSREGYKKQF